MMIWIMKIRRIIKTREVAAATFFSGEVNVRTLFIKQIQQDNNDIPQTGSSLSDSTLIQHLSEGDEIRRSRPFFFGVRIQYFR